MDIRLCLAVVVVGGFFGGGAGSVVRADPGEADATEAVAVVAPTSEAEIAAQAGRVRTLGDERAVDVADEWEDFESENENLIGSVAREAVSFDEAIAKARELAKKAAGPAVVKAARAKVSDTDDVAVYRGLAVREAMLGNPDGAFCYLLAAHDSDPKNADALSDLAGALAMLGYANEALAILDELSRRGAVISPPMGLTSDDVLEYSRGYALLRLGEQGEARKKLEAVRDRQPFLAEAPKLLALLDAHEGKNPRKNFILGIWRARAQVAVCAGVDSKKPEPDPFEEDEERENDEVAIDVRSWLDLGKGKPGVLPNVPYAVTAKQANGLVKKLEAAEAAEDATLNALSEQRRAVNPRKYVHSDSDVEETWGYRMETILRAIDYRDPKLRVLNQREHEAWDEARKALAKIEDERQTKTDIAVERLLRKNPKASLRDMGEAMQFAFDAALGHARSSAMRQEKAIRDRFAEWHLLATALAGEVGDTKWREHIRLSIEAERTRTFIRLMHVAAQHARIGELPLLELEDSGGPGRKDEQGMGQCDGNKSVGASTNSLGFGDESPIDVGLEMTCEGMSLEASVEIFPKLQISGEIGFDKKGGYSVFIGPKIDGTVMGSGGTWKGGIGVSGSRGRGVTDVTAKMETKTVVSAGGISRATKIGDQSMSFMPAPRGGPPADLVPIGTK